MQALVCGPYMYEPEWDEPRRPKVLRRAKKSLSLCVMRVMFITDQRVAVLITVRFCVTLWVRFPVPGCHEAGKQVAFMSENIPIWDSRCRVSTASCCRPVIGPAPPGPPPSRLPWPNW